MKVSVHMTGCKNNRYEIEQIISWAIKNNVYLTDESEADYCVINTCTVTHVADKKSRQMIRRNKKKNPHMKTIVFGCAARIQKEEFSKIREVDYLLPDLKSVLEFLDEQRKSDENPIADCMRHCYDHGHSRALVQIQDGCENFCSYCIIAKARGRSKSRSEKEIIDEINGHFKNGYNEVILTGINIGAYGCSMTTKPEESRFAELLEAILRETEMPRIRISSMGPEYFFICHPDRSGGIPLNRQLLNILKNPRICRHFHISAQSGSDSVLKRMRRNYTVRQMDEIIERLKANIPGVAITTDIITGFPGETDEEFAETLDFIRRHRLAKIHVFPYSIRQGTLAAKMEQVSDDIKKGRAGLLQSVAEALRKEFIESQTGKKMSVLWEKEISPGVFEGITDNYVRVRRKGDYSVRGLSVIRY